jgi:rfaE bifunctional protein nucleotidyltransferase chain/domain
MPVRNLISRTKIAALAARLKRGGKRVVFTNGVFDILHRGYLAKAKSLGDVLILGLNSDASVRRIKGSTRPLQRQSDRAVILLALESVDYVVIFGEDTPDKLIRQIKPDILVKGADYKVSEIVGADFVRSHGGSVRRIRLTPGRKHVAGSSTTILPDNIKRNSLVWKYVRIVLCPAGLQTRRETAIILSCGYAGRPEDHPATI